MTADIVNTDVTLRYLTADHTGVRTVRGGHANGLPIGYDGTGTSGGARKQVTKTWKQSSEWFDVLHADFDFTVGISWMWGIRQDGRGHYIDQLTTTLAVGYLPADLTVDVQADFPTHGARLGRDDDMVAGMPVSLSITLDGVFGQPVSFSHRKSVVVLGDGTWQWPR